MQEQSTLTGSVTGEAAAAVLAGDTTESPKGPKPYRFDELNLHADVPWGENITLRVHYTKPEFEHHETYEANVKREEIIVDGESEDLVDAEAANVEYFDALVQRAEKFRRGEKVPFETWERDKCVGLPEEVKTTVVSRMGRCQFEVVGGESDEALFSPTGEMVIRQWFGDDDAPEHEIFYKMKIMSKSERSDYQSGVKTKGKTKKRKTINTTKITLLRKAVKHFGPHLISVQGGELESGPFTPERRQDFIEQIDDGFKFLVIETMVAYFRRGRD